MLTFLVVATLLVAFANGANDNFKGVATLFGSGLTRFWPAMIFATLATLAGSGLALILADALLSSFSGKGLVPSELTTQPDYAAAVAFAAGATVLIATRLGLPVSTTHALIGSLLGAALAGPGGINWSLLGTKFALPLLLSPVLAFAMTGTLTLFATAARRLLGSDETLEMAEPLDQTTESDAPASAIIEMPPPASGLGDATLNTVHWLSAGSVSFARGVNDTPKIAALLLLCPGITKASALALIGATIALGGLLAARGVADTLANRITAMSPKDGVLANLATTAIVLSASRLGLPVSTTHVSGSALIGLGAMTGGGHWRMIGVVALAWLLTVPLGIIIGFSAYTALSQ